VPKRNDDFFKQKKVWSEVKDELLGCYLTPYFNKIFHTRKPILYVDGFAGKGKFEDGKNGSPLTALECLSTSISNFRGNHSIPMINMKFIELNHANDLIANLPNEHTSRCEVIAGKFEDKIVPVLEDAAKVSNSQNVFLYIDPYGVKALDAALFDVLPDIFSTAEVLINLNSWGFLRMAFAIKKTDFRESADELLKDLEEYDSSTARTTEEINAIAGGDYWQDIVDRYISGLIDGYEAEKEFSYKYKLRLRKKYNYVLDMPIRLKQGQHPKYRMVYATNHPDGCILMADNIAARTDRLIFEIQNKGQMSLFQVSAENEFVSLDSLAEYVRTLLTRYDSHVRLKECLADFYNEYGVLYSSSKLRGALATLEQAKLIEVVRTPDTTRSGKVSRFWDDKDGRTIKIKLIKRNN
jgi:three-Cys-motif partner protein